MQKKSKGSGLFFGIPPSLTPPALKEGYSPRDQHFLLITTWQINQRETLFSITPIFVSTNMVMDKLNGEIIKLTSTIQIISRYTDLNILTLNSIKLLEYAR